VADPVLEVRKVSAAYGRIKVLKEISLLAYPGEIVSIIGANGAGKSTTLMTICNIVQATSGEVYYQGARITGLAPDRLPPMGLCQVPEGRRIFPRLTIQENLELGAFFRKDQSSVKDDLKYVFGLFPILGERRNQRGGTLSGGEQQMLAIARALMGHPKLLLLDEPSLGLAPLIVQQIFSIIKDINEKDGTTILLVEQNANLALNVSARSYVMETGRVVMENKSSVLLENQDIRKAYLGD
jgi:branched-chain amino acid transport system ATP-binding protein